jgi:hypothetical protein
MIMEKIRPGITMVQAKMEIVVTFRTRKLSCGSIYCTAGLSVIGGVTCGYLFIIFILKRLDQGHFDPKLE